ncbi:MAG: helix-turn-helix domain-containing protein [Sandaracinaceae bacterium]
MSTSNQTEPPTAKPHRRWLTFREAAALVGVSYAEIRRWEGRGLIRVSRPTPRIARVDRRSLDQLLEAHAPGGEAA